MTATRALSAADIPWQDILIWSGLLLILYALHEVFAVVFLTFLLTYLVRAIVVPLARRIRPGQENRSLERWLTLGTFLAIVLVLWGLARLMAPQFVLQGRLLAAHAERLEAQAVLDHVLARTVGAYLFRKTYGTPDDPRYQAGITAFAAENRAGEGAYAGFGQLRTRVQSGFEIAYETAARGRLEHETGERGDIGRDFDAWFLSVKAPALVAERRATYLARLQTPDGQSQPADAAGLEPRLAELALQDLDANPSERARLVSQWEQTRAKAQWRQLQASPEYRAAFESWFAGPGGMAEKLPYDAVTYLALRDAYPRGLAAFKQVYQERVATTPAGVAAERLDFQRAKELELARQWWYQSPAASSLREHLQKDATEVASAAAERIAAAVRGLIAIPAQLGTALLLTILISFDMVGLKQGARRLREGRLAGVYAKVVPNLAAVARLIGRSFAAQGVIAVFNTLLTFALMRLLGLQNELLLACIVFIASMVPVLGIIISAVPIGLQALLQPDGSLELALYALLGIGVIHAIESMVLSPRIVGKILHLHPVLVLAILVIGEHLFGIWGLLLGVPLAVYAIHAGILREGIPGIYEPSKAAPP